MDNTTASGIAVETSSLSSIGIAVVLGAVGILWFLVFGRPNNNNSGKSATKPYPPHPKPCHPIWGNAPQLPDVSKGYHIDPKLLEWAKEYGPVFSLKVPILGTMICVADPDLIKYITISKNYNKSWTYQNNLHLFGARSIVMVNGDEWKRYRKTFAPAFTTSFLKDMVSVMCDKVDRMIHCLDRDAAAGVPSNMVERTQTLTSDVIVQLGFGEDWGGDKPHAANGIMKEITDITVVMGKSIWANLFGFDMKKRLKELEAKLDVVMNEILDKRLRQLNDDDDNDQGSISRSNQTKSNVCALVIEALKQPDGSLTSEDRTVILHQLRTIFFAGFDTTSTTLSWAVWLLSQNPEILTKLRAELQSKNIFNNTNQEERPTYDQLQECEYLDAVIKEVLRLYPPGATARYVADAGESWKDYRLGGAVLYVNCYVTHRLPEYWGDNADDFMPERFVGVDPSDYSHKYFPFLKGPRDCLGKYFALLEAKLALSAMVQRYDMTCINHNESIGYRLTAYPRDGACVEMKLRDLE